MKASSNIKKLSIFSISMLLLVAFALRVDQSSKKGNFQVPELWLASRDSAFFELKKGDILVRPNWPWFLGSYNIPSGRRYGHVAVVVEGAKGKTPYEALSKATVIEALFFDQKTRSFMFKKEQQVRKIAASVSFGERFNGIRYLVRYDLNEKQLETICDFLNKQLDSGYNILSLKIGPKEKRRNWNCATIAWMAFMHAKIDIDGNKGAIIYPSDILKTNNSLLGKQLLRF